MSTVAKPVTSVSPGVGQSAEVGAPARVAALARRGLDRGSGVLSLLVGVAVWEVASRVWEVPAFPPLSRVVLRVGTMAQEGELLGNLGTSLGNLLLGFGLAAAVGMVVGLVMGVSEWVEGALDIYVNALLTAPSLIFAPIVFSFFGLGSGSIITVVFLYSAFIIMVNTATAVKGAPENLRVMAASYGASRWQIFRRVLIPCALPLTFAGLRLGVGRAVKGMLNGEMFIAVVGLGAVVTSAGQQSDAETVLAVLLVIIVVASVAVWAVGVLDRRCTRWLPDVRRAR